MVERVKNASPYLLILVLVFLLIVFNFWSSKVRADDVGTSVDVGNSAPTIGAISINGGSNITLVEGTTVDIMVSASIADANGCNDVRNEGGVKAIVYLYNEQNASCSQDNNNCYDEDIASCSWQSTTGNTCSYECTASSAMYYYADPTVTGGGTASKADEEWAVTVIASDSYWEDVTSNSWDPGTSGSTSVEVALLLGLDVSAGSSNSIDYDEGGTLSADSESSTLERGVKNTGNRPMDPLIAAAQDNALCTDYSTCAGGVITAAHQQFSNVTFSMDSGTSLSASNQTLDLELPQKTDDTGASESDDQIFWALYVPAGQAVGAYTGTNTYTAAAD